MPMRHRGVLAALIVATIVAGIMAFASGRAHAATKCIAPAKFFADMPTLKPTPIPPPGYARARELLEAVAKTKPKMTDSAWLMEASDGSMILLYGARGCIRVMLPVPTNVPVAAMRFILLGERPVTPPNPRDNI